MKLSEKEWQEFDFSALKLEVVNSKAYHLANVEEDDTGVAYLTRTKYNNSFNMCVKNNALKINPANTISFGAESAHFFYQPSKYITGNKMYYVKNSKINKFIGLFLQCSLQSSVESCFSFGNGMIPERVKKKKIVLPVDANGDPDWNFIEDYIKNTEQKKVIDYIAFVTEKIKKFKYKRVPELKDKKWKLFCIGELFELQKGKCSNASILNDGKIPYVGATNRNNGILKFVNEKEKMLSDGNCIVFIGAGDGSAGLSVYKKEKCICASSNVCGYNEYLNEYTGLFISACSDMNESKYSHGYSRIMQRLSKDKVILPVNDVGDPDYEYMEQYIKNLEYKKIKEYMAYIE